MEAGRKVKVKSELGLACYSESSCCGIVEKSLDLNPYGLDSASNLRSLQFPRLIFSSVEISNKSFFWITWHNMNKNFISCVILYKVKSYYGQCL